MLYTKPSGSRHFFPPLRTLLVATFLLTGLSGCIPPSLPDIRGDIEARETLRAGIQYAPSRYEIGPQGKQGFDYELVAGFADYLSVDLVLIPYFDIAEMEQALTGQQIDILVPGAAFDEFHTPEYKQGPRYLDTAWQLNPAQDDSLQAALFDFFSTHRQQGRFEQLSTRYLSPATPITAADINQLVENAQPDMKILRTRFDGMSKQLSWTLLAALTFQLNGWEDLESNAAAAEQFLSALSAIPQQITADQKIPMALAAFYSGHPHLIDARTLTREQGGDENNWLDVQQRYPALEKSEVYRHLKAGYVNGTNTVLFVSNVLDYQRALIALEAQ